MSVLSTDEIDMYIDPATGDLTATGDIAMTSGIAAVVQGARTRLRIIAGEWFLDRALGIGYFERDGVSAARAIIGQKFDRAKTLREFRTALLGSAAAPGVPGITSLTRLEVTFDGPTRTIAVTWQARCTFGDTPTDSLVIGV